jgi:phosphoglycolate phosphatase
MLPLRAILFDFDGTLVQTRETSWLLFERTNRKFALGIDDREQYFDLFRDNMLEALPRVCGDRARGQAALEHFLELLRTEYRPPLVPGMLDVVRALSPHCVLVIISTNALSAIRRIVDEAGMANCIAHVFAGDVVPDKRVAIRQFLTDPSYATLRSCSDAYKEQEPVAFRPDEVAFVTDTVGDVRQALECGIRAIGVGWGLHAPQALLDVGAERVAHWPQEIVSWARPPQAADTTFQLVDVLDPAPAGDAVTEKSLP